MDKGRPVYRINIKFHGSQFRRSVELVGLASEDCFALATYKINSALQKQSEEGLPYFFAIVGVPHLTGAVVGEGIPQSMIELVALVQQSKRATRKRDIEDAVVNFMVASEDATYRNTLSRILDSNWYVLSARRCGHIVAGVALRQGVRVAGSQLCTGVQGRRTGHALLAGDRSHPTPHLSAYASNRGSAAHHDPHGTRRLLIKPFTGE